MDQEIKQQLDLFVELKETLLECFPFEKSRSLLLLKSIAIELKNDPFFGDPAHFEVIESYDFFLFFAHVSPKLGKTVFEEIDITIVHIEYMISQGLAVSIIYMGIDDEQIGYLKRTDEHFDQTIVEVCTLPFYDLLTLVLFFILVLKNIFNNVLLVYH